VSEITQEMIDKALKDFRGFDKVNPDIIPTPTRFYNVDDECAMGALEDCVVKEVLHDGKAYRIECISVDHNYGNPIRTPKTLCRWWFDIEDKVRASKTADELFAPRLPGQIQTSSLDSLVHMMAHSGLVCDPRYQRDYVWNDDNQEALIDSIFNRIGIGSLIFSRNAGYLDRENEELVTYINLDGDEVQIPKNTDYTCAVIDGQQRLTTVWRFYTNQFTYKGRYFKDLCFHDQGNFHSTLLAYRLFDADSVNYKEVLRMFIRTNRGVPQDEKHLDKVKKQLEKLE